MNPLLHFILQALGLPHDVTFQQIGVPPHFALIIRNILDQKHKSR